jgi:selenocysteine lyase/cysteine desulfurase
MGSLSCQKSLFEIPEDVHYINCAYMSPLMPHLEEVASEVVNSLKHPYKTTVTDFFEPSAVLKQNFARLIKVDNPERIAIIPSVSYGIANVIHNIKMVSGQNIVIASEQFPSNVYPWMHLCDINHGELRQISRPKDDKTWNEAIIDRIDDNTTAVSLGHVHWADGHKFDLPRIADVARQHGALVIIDGTQSVGALHFPIDDIRPDALICAGYKWLMGPYSIGLAYYGSYFDDKEPIEHNWINRKDSDIFQRLVNYQALYRPAANRFSVGETSNFILTPIMSAALEQLNLWTISGIQNYCSDLIRDFVDQWRAMGYSLNSGDEFASHLFGIRLPGGQDSALIKPLLEKHNVFVSIRGDAIRVAPHVYNDRRDMEALTNALEDFVTLK